MIFRGSLRGSIMNCAEKFKSGAHPFLGIVCNPRGKYYTVVTVDELLASPVNDDKGHQRLLFYGTEKELRTFCKYEQIELFGDSIDVNNTENF